MQLKDVMTPHVRGISSSESVQSAAQGMDQLGVGCIPVFQDGLPIGIVTDRDIVLRAVANGQDCAQTPVSEVMTAGIVSLPETAAIEEAVLEMEERQIRRLLVRNEEDQVVGIVSLGDIAAKYGNPQVSAELIEKVSLPTEPIT